MELPSFNDLAQKIDSDSENEEYSTTDSGKFEKKDYVTYSIHQF